MRQLPWRKVHRNRGSKLEDPPKFGVPAIANYNCINDAGATRTIKVFNIAQSTWGLIWYGSTVLDVG